MKGEWLIKPNERGYTGCFECNLLWRYENIYVMDNHRLALWCWMQHLGERKVDLIHIDEHYDCIDCYHDSWLKSYPASIRNLSLDEYMNYPWEDDGHRAPLFRFDNYLSLFMDHHKDQVTNPLLCTHRDGDTPKFKFSEVNTPDILSYLNARISNTSIPTILNLDLDYFTDTGFSPVIEIFSRDYIKRIAEMIKEGLDSGSILTLTIALSPDSDFTGSWARAEDLATFFMSHIGHDFKLPI